MKALDNKMIDRLFAIQLLAPVSAEECEYATVAELLWNSPPDIVALTMPKWIEWLDSSTDAELLSEIVAKRPDALESISMTLVDFRSGAEFLHKLVTDSLGVGVRVDGGPGSGNWGHGGRPGKRGGSTGGGGVHNRMTAEGGGYTSFSQEKKKLAKPHQTNMQEPGKAPEGTKVLFGGGSWTKQVVHQVGDDDYDVFVNDDTGEVEYPNFLLKKCSGQDVRLAVPESANKNYLKPKNDDDRFSEERRSRAFKTEDPSEADGQFRAKSGEIWKGLDDESKNALYSYTGSEYENINGKLRTGSSWKSGVNEEINCMTKAIEQSALERDIWLYRGINNSAAEKMLGLKVGDLDEDEWFGGGNIDVSVLVGKTCHDDGFMSCGTAKGTGFDHKNVQLEIYCPAGTQALYVEPFSAMGRGDGRTWDGESEQFSYSGELETILQRGTEMQIISAERKNGKVYLTAQVVAQKYSPINTDEDEIQSGNFDSETIFPEKSLDFLGNQATITSETNKDGGSGSGNHGHAGRKGQIGGSAARMSGAQKAAYRQQIVGKTTSDGVTIKGISDHAFARIAERKISPGRINQMIASPKVYPDKKHPTRRCYDVKGSRLVLDSTTGDIVTIEWRRQNK